MDNIVYLCYDKETDSIISSSYRVGVVLFESHDGKGYKHNHPKFKVPDTDFEIQISSNFGYGSRSYLRCQVWNHQTRLLSYDQWIECYTSDLKYFNVTPTPDNWLQLFKIIEDVYRNKEIWNYDNAIDLLEKLQAYLKDISSLNIRHSKWTTNIFQYNNCQKIKYVIKKIMMLLSEFDEVKLLQYKQIKIELISVCNELISLIATSYKGVQNSEESPEVRQEFLHQLEIGYDAIHKFLSKEQSLEIIITNLK